jgi:predicted Zn-dependent protease
MFGGGLKIRLMIAAAIALFAVISYYASPGDKNMITGKTERVAMADEQQEVAMGLQAAPQMVQQHGGPSRNAADRDAVQRIGVRLLQGLDSYMGKLEQETGEQLDNPYQFNFTLLADPRTVNAFALPGGQVFMTQGLFDRLETEGQLAGVLGHEIGHVIERHGNKRMAKQKLFSGLAAAGGVAGGDVNSARMSQMVTQMISMRYGRDDELESDKWGVRLCVESGYDPYAMLGLMKVLEEASGGGGPPEMMSTHPKPANRVKYIREVIESQYPNGLPGGLRP